MNMILSHMLRKFREENGRGPDSLELLEMRKALADRLGVDVPPVDARGHDEEGEEGEERGTPRKVVVAEERNETEEIPCREVEDEGDDKDENDKDEEDGLSGKKRPAPKNDDDGNDEQRCNHGDSNKKAKSNGDNHHESDNGSKDGEEAES